MSEPKTLLTRPITNTKDPLGWMWIVSENKDYRLSLGTLPSFVTAASIGLGEVDNTRDQDKPISTATQAALNLKADLNIVATKQQLDALATELQNYVPLTVLNQALSNINDALASKATPAQVATMISDALLPINQALQTLANRIQVIEDGNSPKIVNQTQLANAIGALQASIAALIDSKIATAVDPILLSITNHISEYIGFRNATNASLADLQDQINNLDLGGNLILGPNDW